MRFLSLMIFNLILSQSNLALAKEELVAIPTNSPVKETYLKVKLEGFDAISEVLFKPKNGGSEVAGEVTKEGTAIIGKFKVSFLKPGKYEYRVKTRSASGNSQQNEAASVAFINFEIDSSLGVADPGEAGIKTLGGIDSDNNGVRDDVQRWINESFNSNANMKKALNQIAKSDQSQILNSNNEEKASLLIKDKRPIDCLYERMEESDLVYSSMINDYEKLTYNTLERLKAFVKIQNLTKRLNLDQKLGKKDTSIVCD